ncbi:hypothetical protein OTSUT76_1516 [Orientia tsutsugamushi str. UT76]|nr:hypothetical protein OTSUT76_1516 [Orientia tsutsugamushi str. UT76]
MFCHHGGNLKYDINISTKPIAIIIIDLAYADSDNLLLDLTADSAFLVCHLALNLLLLYSHCLNCPVALLLLLLLAILQLLLAKLRIFCAISNL